ncbi:MAG TPA: gamma-glutamyltransferase [Alphaproteobacteria bacterium]
MTGPAPAPRRRSVCNGLALALALLGALPAAADQGRVQPEPGTGAAARGPATAAHEMIAAANPYAAEAGAAVLAQGGSAVDAAIAAQMVLNLVEPQSSGVGGGAFLVTYDAARGMVETFDGRETAPAAAAPALFVRPDGTLPGYLEALVGGRSVGVPGLLRMLEAAHRAHGRLAWRTLFEPAIALAEQGFPISPRLAALAGRVPTLARFADTAGYFLGPDAMPKPAGTVLRNPELAATFRHIAEGGAEAFYHGDIAADIAAAVAGAPVNPGLLAESDLAAYRARQRPPVCLTYRGYRVCGMGPPSSGGVAVLQILGLLSRFDLAALAPDSVEAVHLFAEASRLAFADRDRYLADPDFVAVPTWGLLDPGYLAARAALIDTRRAAPGRAAGTPPGARQAWQSGAAPEFAATSHLSVVDRDGNAAALTTSIEFAFGSALMVRGFLLNNQLTDFSFQPERDGRPVANRVEAGKRPLSSMAPTVVFDPEGRLALVVGSPGGSRIICYVAKTIVAVIDWGADVQRAIDQPNRCNRGGATELEADTALAALSEALAARGHEVEVVDMNSGLHAIAVVRAGAVPALAGGADSRREGRAVGR